MALQVFIDESGGKGQPGYLVLMGLVLSAEEWAAFSDEWDRLLRAEPPIRYFKWAEAWKASGEFHHFSRERSLEKAARLAAVIQRFEPPSTVRLMFRHSLN